VRDGTGTVPGEQVKRRTGIKEIRMVIMTWTSIWLYGKAGALFFENLERTTTGK
jgi:hypothetical protein